MLHGSRSYFIKKIVSCGKTQPQKRPFVRQTVGAPWTDTHLVGGLHASKAFLKDLVLFVKTLFIIDVRSILGSVGLSAHILTLFLSSRLVAFTHCLPLLSVCAGVLFFIKQIGNGTSFSCTPQSVYPMKNCEDTIIICKKSHHIYGSTQKRKQRLRSTRLCFRTQRLLTLQRCTIHRQEIVTSSRSRCAANRLWQ